MNAPTVRGRCPSLMAPMEAGDGLLVRVKPRAATLAAEQADAVSEASRRFGNGIVELTNRGHLQIRGLSEDSVEGLSRSMAEIGLAGASPRAEAVRNVLADPLGPDDSNARFDSHDLARRLGAVLAFLSNRTGSGECRDTQGRSNNRLNVTVHGFLFGNQFVVIGDLATELRWQIAHVFLHLRPLAAALDSVVGQASLVLHLLCVTHGILTRCIRCVSITASRRRTFVRNIVRLLPLII